MLKGILLALSLAMALAAAVLTSMLHERTRTNEEQERATADRVASLEKKIEELLQSRQAPSRSAAHAPSGYDADTPVAIADPADTADFPAARAAPAKANDAARKREPLAARDASAPRRAEEDAAEVADLPEWTESPQFEERIRGVMLAFQEEEEQERIEQQRAQFVSRMSERVKRHSERLGLNGSQEDEIIRIYGDGWERRRVAVAEAQNGMEWGGDDIRNRTREIRQETDQAIANVLTAQQYDEYKVIQNEEGDGFRWGGDGPRRRRDNDNSGNTANPQGTTTETPQTPR